MNNTKLIHELSIIENSPRYLIIKEKFWELEKYARNIIIEKTKLIDDFIYKNLETNVLQSMKLKIENELLERRLKMEKQATPTQRAESGE